jgi:ketosteroid isomerase-like protein
MPIEQRVADAYEVKDGKIARAIMSNPDVAAALEAVRLAKWAMPQQNIGVVRDHYDATNERDFARAMAHFDVDVELVVPPGYLEPGEYKGRDAVGAWFGDWFSSFDRDARFDVKETTELDGGAVLLVADHHARGKVSGIEVHGTVVWLYGFRRGKIARVEGYTTRVEALKAMGLAD